MISLKTVLRGWLTAIAILVLVSASAFADGNETLGPPSISIAAGSGYVSSGVGLTQSQPGIINLNVPAGATISQVLIYWEGQHSTANGDDAITVNGNDVVGTLIGGPDYFFSNNGGTLPVYSSTYRADITGLGVVAAGANGVSVGDMSNDIASNGAGIFVIYTDALPNTEIQLVDGNDLAYKFFPNPRGTMVEQTFTFTAASVARNANLSMFFSSVQGILSTGGVLRPNQVRVTVGATTTTFTDELLSNNGQEWDTMTKTIIIPAGETQMKVIAISGPDGDEDPNTTTPQPASFAWNAIGLSIPCSGLIGDFVWKDSDCDGVQDPGEQGIPGVTVQLLDCTTNEVIATDVTDANGYYSFEGLCPGCYKVMIDETTIPAGYVPTTCSNTANVGNNSNCSPATVTLTPDTQEDRTIDFGYCDPACTGKIGNFVWKDNDCDGLQENGEPGIPGVIVRLLDCKTGEILQIDTTDANGFYLFDSLCADCYNVEVDPSTVPLGYIPTICANTPNAGTNSNCSPAEVTLTSNSNEDLTIDFGYCDTRMCVLNSSISSNFNGTPIVGTPSNPRYLWFNANFKRKNQMTAGTSIFVTGANVTFSVNGNPIIVNIPNGKITFKNIACVTTSFVGGMWVTEVPLSEGDDIFMTGYPMAVYFTIPGGTNPVKFSATFSSDQPGGFSLEWKWSAAVYTCFDTTNYNTIQVKPSHQNACTYNNGNHAGTPQNAAFKACVIGGGRGGGGSDWTGSWSGTGSVKCVPVRTGHVAPSTGEGEQLIETIPDAYELRQNFPNPFNPETEIYFQIGKTGKASLKIFNTLGQEIKTLVDGELEAGIHTYTWDGTDNTGNHVASGLYFYQLRSGEFSAIKKMSLMK